jgi:hypothetical protein
MEGKKWGRGKLTRNDGVSCSGHFVEDLPHGMVEFVYPNGMKHVGKYDKGVLTGTYTWIELDGAEYIGKYNTDWQREGFGERLEANGSIYEGHWKADKRNGNGDYTCTDYNYVGEYKDDLRHGQGRISYTADGSVYDGQFVNDMFDGQGGYMCAATRYVGNFRQNKYHGAGKLVHPDGTKHEGTWSNGVLQTVAQIVTSASERQQDTDTAQDDNSDDIVTEPLTKKKKQ